MITSIRHSLAHAGSLPWAALAVGTTFTGAATLYARTAAPSVLSGDSGEFQFAAALLGVPHPTGYPLYILLGKLATLLPLGDVAYRVTLVSAFAGAGTVALLALLVLRVTGNLLASLIAATALAVAPGLWHLSTIAEVYTLNTLLLVLLALLVLHACDSGSATADHRRRRLYAAAFVTGLGISHHGSFAFTGAPLLACAVVPVLLADHRRAATDDPRDAPFMSGRWAFLIRLALSGALGLTPWLFVLARYAQLGPFDGLDNGLPRTYFWGAPTNWSAALSHVVGGTMRGGVFDLPGPRTLINTVFALWDRLQFEFGPLGVPLGVVGCYSLLRRPPWLWLGSAWVLGITALYFASLGSAVQDAPVFTLPMLLPWALWIGVGAAALANRVNLLLTNDERPEIAYRGTTGGAGRGEKTGPPGAQRRARGVGASLVACVLLVLMLGWGHTRWIYGDKSDQWLFREFGERALARMESGAAVLTRWEQGTILQYLRLVEGQRPDVWVDIIEFEDAPWLERARQRYPDRPVYIIGSPEDAAALEAEHVWGTEYAAVFRLSTARR